MTNLNRYLTTGTSAYEIMTRMGKRLPVVYIQKSKRVEK